MVMQGILELGSTPGAMSFNQGGVVPGSGNKDTVNQGGVVPGSGNKDTVPAMLNSR